jgi:hypothetical protein
VQESETRVVDNPFALMLNPEAVFQAMSRSDRLSRLKTRICRPLDTPVIPKKGADLAVFDAGIDSLEEPAEPPETEQ